MQLGRQDTSRICEVQTVLHWVSAEQEEQQDKKAWQKQGNHVNSSTGLDLFLSTTKGKLS